MTDFRKLPGYIQEITPVRIYQAANDTTPVVIATASGSALIPVIRLLSLTFRVRVAAHTDLTNIQITAGAGLTQVLFNSEDGDRAEFDADGKHVSWNGGQAGIELGNGETIVAVLAGTGPTFIDGDVTARYAIIDPGATLE